MAFWEDFSEIISTKSKEAADKAKTLTDIANLKGQIVTQENALLRNYREIGRAYYNAHKNDTEKEFPDEMNNIAKAKRTISELNKKISELKGTKKCASCGCEMANDSAFCPRCGQKVEDATEDFFDDDDIETNTDIIIPDEITDIIEEDDTELL